MEVLENMKVVVFGVANYNSLAWAITVALLESGATVALASHPKLVERVRALAGDRVECVIPCDVTDDAMLDICYESLAAFAPFHGAVHCIAFSDKEELKGRYVDTSRENFQVTMDVSVYSFTDLCRRMEPLMSGGGSIVTLSFDASRGTYPNYNVMGIAKGALEASVRYAARDLGPSKIRVNALSPSPEDTVSAHGISNFRRIGDFAEAMSPMGRRATRLEIGNAAVFLLSDMSSGMTGQVMLVDCGASTSIMPPPWNAAKMGTAMTKVAEVYEKEKAGEQSK